MKFLVWVPEHGYIEEDAEEIIDWGCPEDIAEEYVKNHYADWDYPEEVEMAVKDEKGIVHRFSVCAEADVRFRAYTRKDNT